VVGQVEHPHDLAQPRRVGAGHSTGATPP
jgi:hypothetical protein